MATAKNFSGFLGEDLIITDQVTGVSLGDPITLTVRDAMGLTLASSSSTIVTSPTGLQVSISLSSIQMTSLGAGSWDYDISRVTFGGNAVLTWGWLVVQAR